MTTTTLKSVEGWGAAILSNNFHERFILGRHFMDRDQRRFLPGDENDAARVEELHVDVPTARLALIAAILS